MALEGEYGGEERLASLGGKREERGREKGRTCTEILRCTAQSLQ